MKNNCIIFLLLCIITVTTLGFTGGSSKQTRTLERTQYLRIHIRADSNAASDQAVKYNVRDLVVEYLTPVIAKCQSMEQAREKLSEKLPTIAVLATSILREQGFVYGATARIAYEQFPTRVYEDLVLPQGEYLALVVELGSGQGDNWWCVAYPPLCFTATQNVVYKSKILEIISRWKSVR